MSDNPNLPNYQHPKYREALSSLTFIEDMWVGRSNWYRYNDSNDIPLLSLSEFQEYEIRRFIQKEAVLGTD